MSEFEATVGFVIIISLVVGVGGQIIRKLERAERERQHLMDVVARIEANVEWTAGMTKATEGQHRYRQEVAAGNVDYRRFE